MSGDYYVKFFEQKVGYTDSVRIVVTEDDPLGAEVRKLADVTQPRWHVINELRGLDLTVVDQRTLPPVVYNSNKGEYYAEIPGVEHRLGPTRVKIHASDDLEQIRQRAYAMLSVVRAVEEHTKNHTDEDVRELATVIEEEIGHAQPQAFEYARRLLNTGKIKVVLDE